MKILITGENGYIAKSLYAEIEKYENLIVKKCSVKNFNSTQLNLEGINTIVHTAAIVHKKESSQSKDIYREVNTDLTIKLAQKAKLAGVKHFIFMSTMAVYGDKNGEINKATPLNPTTLYGESKLLAENELMKLTDDSFKVSIVRPPMVYGPNCPGNYSLLSKLAKKTFIFPKTHNKRSMIFIGNLVEFLKQIILDEDSGIFHPQDRCYVNTEEMVLKIAESHAKKIVRSEMLSFLIRIFLGKKNIYQKIFGDLYYSDSLSTYKNNSYQKYDFKEAIYRSESKLDDE